MPGEGPQSSELGGDAPLVKVEGTCALRHSVPGCFCQTVALAVRGFDPPHGDFQPPEQAALRSREDQA